MSTLSSLLHNPPTVISVGVGFFIILVFGLIFGFKDKLFSKPKAENIEAPIEEVEPDGVDYSLDFLLGTTPALVTPAGTISIPAGQTRYHAMVFTESGIKFKTIKEQFLTLIYCDPTMPKSGQRYLCVEKEGKIIPYDPRDSSINSKDTAHRAWRATHCLDIVRDMFATPPTNLQKLNMIFMWVFCGGLLFLGIVALSKI